MAYIILCEHYAHMSEGFYAQYQAYGDWLKANPDAWNMTDHPDKIEQVHRSFQLKLENAIMAVICQAMAIEAYVNLFGTVQLGANYYEKYEKGRGSGNTLDKLKCLCKDELKKGYPTGNKSYNTMDGLFKKRNALMHTKPKEIDLRSDNAKFAQDCRQQIGFIFKNIDLEMEAYKDLKETIRILRGDQKDICQLIHDGMCNDLKEAIHEMHSEAGMVPRKEKDGSI